VPVIVGERLGIIDEGKIGDDLDEF